MKRKLFVIAVLTAHSFGALFAQSKTALSVVPGLSETDLKNLTDKPAVIGTASVSALPKNSDGKSYFATRCDTHAVSTVSIDKIYAVLNDFANYPKYFSGSKKIEVINKNADGPVVKATAGAAILTFSYVYQQREPVNKPDEHYIVREGINAQSDDKMQNMYTEYYLKSVTVGGKTLTYIRTRDAVDYLSGVVGNYMKDNNEKSQKNGLTDIIKAASKK